MTDTDFELMRFVFGFRSGEEMRKFAERQQRKDTARQINQYKNG